jgi:hypothetical protein
MEKKEKLLRLFTFRYRSGKRGEEINLFFTFAIAQVYDDPTTGKVIKYHNPRIRSFGPAGFFPSA